MPAILGSPKIISQTSLYGSCGWVIYRMKNKPDRFYLNALQTPQKEAKSITNTNKGLSKNFEPALQVPQQSFKEESSTHRMTSLV